jgi:hypothetical protein
MLLGNPGETDYVWNNVLYDIQGNGPAYPQVSGQYGNAFYAWNNSIDVSISATSTPCFRNVSSGSIATVHIQNNQCIGGTFSAGLAATDLQVDHNVTMSPAQAAAAGYAKTELPWAYYPPTATSATVDTGRDLSSYCTGATASLCHDTSYGAVETSDHQVQIVPRTTVARPQGAGWDVGAYDR